MMSKMRCVKWLETDVRPAAARFTFHRTIGGDRARTNTPTAFVRRGIIFAIIISRNNCGVLLHVVCVNNFGTYVAVKGRKQGTQAGGARQGAPGTQDSIGARQERGILEFSPPSAFAICQPTEKTRPRHRPQTKFDRV